MLMVPEGLFIGIFFWALIASMGMLMFALTIKKYAPEAFIFWKARREKKPIALVHYPEGIVRAYIPKEEKRLNPSTTNYWYVADVGIKFKGSTATVEKWEGNIPVFHYYMNIPESIATREAVALSQFKQYLKEKGKIDINGIEDIAIFIISRYENYIGKYGLSEDEAMRQTLKESGLDNEEMVQKMIDLIKFIEKHRSEIERMKLNDGLFTYQIVVNAIDNVSAYTSANIAHTKAVLESAIRESLGSEVKDYIKYGMMIFLGCLGLGVLFILTHTFMG